MKNNPNLWCELLGYYLSRDYLKRGWSTFQKGINELQEESMPLWDMMNLYLLNTNDVMVCFKNALFFMTILYSILDSKTTIFF